MITEISLGRDPLYLRRADYFRCSEHTRASRRQAAGFKEWQHFLVYAPGLRLLINFNLVEPWGSTQSNAAHSPLVGRLIMILEAGGWSGDLDQFSPAEVTVAPGGTSARFGDSAMWFDGRSYRVRAKLANQSLSAELELTPLTEPLLSSHIQLAAGRELSWLILPRLSVSGTVTANGKVTHLRDALGYHDHNWGYFNWGDDFAWEWGSMVPRQADNPWTPVYVRMANRARSTVCTQGLFVWDHERHCRFFRDEDLQVTVEGRRSTPAVHKVPPVMALLSPGTCTDVPQRLVAFGNVAGDQVLMTFNTRNVSQVIIPDETRSDTVTVLNEATGSVDLTGVIGGRPVEMEGSGVFEFIRA